MWREEGVRDESVAESDRLHRERLSTGNSDYSLNKPALTVERWSVHSSEGEDEHEDEDRWVDSNNAMRSCTI